MKNQMTDYLVSPGDTIVAVMACLERNAQGIALVVDPAGKLIGTVTDGDVRRALLKGIGLEAAVEGIMSRRFTAVQADVGRAEVLDLMRARSIEQIPVVDPNGCLLGLHVMREMIGSKARPNWAVVMAGGRGERLRPLTDRIPKPMLRVAGRPILERIVLHLVGYGIREIYLSVNYMGDVIRQHFGDGSAFGCAIRYLEEDQPLHTGGALSLLPAKPEHPLLVMNGDLITQADVGEMLQFHENGAYRITVGTDEYSYTVPFGCLDVADHRVRGLQEKPVVTRLINAGIYVLSPEVLDRVPARQAFPITALVEQALALGEPVGAFRLSGDWIDVGQHDQLRQARGAE